MRKQINTAGDSANKALTILQLLMRDYHPRNFAVRLWDGSQWPAETGSPRFTLILNHPDALRCLLQNSGSDLAISEAYIRGDLDLEGDLEAAMPLATDLTGRHWPISTMLQIGLNLFHLSGNGRSGRNGQTPAKLSGELHSVERDRQAVTYHYDVSNDFYALWLDQQMIYSCAYFETTDDDLDTAQERKLDYLCRKLRLRSGERLLDIGCGWGGLIIHAAQHYDVDALGITLSENQAKLANERIARASLQDRCRVELRDYRDVNETGGFDKLVSVGMFEHVGEIRLPLYFRHAWHLLRPGGVFLNHGIALRASERWPKGPTFLTRYVFPDGHLVPINATLRYAEEAGFEVRDLESLREHYAITLRHWARRLELHRDEALQVVDQPTYRVWKLFLRGSANGFAAGALNVYQALLLRPDEGRSGLPLTRNDWYRATT
ncbi:MAG TPA: cyclopropane-fatty-acyl-phospholipid synthase family protein [Chthoniobacterales bacterium]|nr:cyclopropane-fatty-acyl-phospholipid synthase family protein [Chthoniobacterales bacterium]